MTKPEGVTLEPYSDKSFVLRGDTILYKDDIKSMGGSWGPNLKGGKGWLFPNTKQDIVGRWLDTGEIDQEDIKYAKKNLECQIDQLCKQVYNLQKSVGRVLDMMELLVQEKGEQSEEEDEPEKPVRLLSNK